MGPLVRRQGANVGAGLDWDGVTDRKKVSVALVGLVVVAVILAVFLALVVFPLRTGPWRDIVGLPDPGEPGCLRKAHRVDAIPVVPLNPDEACDRAHAR